MARSERHALAASALCRAAEVVRIKGLAARRVTSRRHLAAAALAALIALTGAPAAAVETVRVATFNLALYGRASGEVLARLRTRTDPQAQRLAEIVQRIRPAVLVLNEIDHDRDGAVLAAFCENYLAVGQNASQSPAAAEPITFPHRVALATNTGEHSGFDLDRNGQIDATPGNPAYGPDCWGYGAYPGQYAFAVLSQYPIDEAGVRQFRKLLWKNMPGARLPDDPATAAPNDWYAPDVLDQFRLSSKNHCDVPVTIGERRVHLLLSHPTPPVFDGPEDRNGCRNHDELRFWVDYIAENSPAPSPSVGRAGEGGEAVTDDVLTRGSATPPLTSPHQGEGNGGYFVDDAGRRGGLGGDAGVQDSGFRVQAGATASGREPSADSRQPPTFLILGDLNGDPRDGDGAEGIRQLLAAPQVLQYPAPVSLGGVEAARIQGGRNALHRGAAAEDTEDAADDPGPGNLRLDYILPSKDLRVADSGVFWPESTDPLHALVAGAAEPASSDHRLVWIDVEF